MSYSPRTILVGAAVSFALTTLARAADTDSLGIGNVASPAQIAGWDIDVRADGEGLPPGHGSVRDGEKIFAETCAACHGAKGEGKPADRLVGGFGTLATSRACSEPPALCKHQSAAGSPTSGKQSYPPTQRTSPNACTVIFG